MERVTGETGTLTSPNYPRSYLPNQQCSKFIETSSNQRLVISFQDFALEPSINCLNDRLLIDDGDKVYSYCGYNLPAELKTNNNSLRIVFKTDLSEQGLGFKLYWRSEPLEVAPLEGTFSVFFKWFIV